VAPARSGSTLERQVQVASRRRRPARSYHRRDRHPGRAFARDLLTIGACRYCLTSRAELDISDEQSIRGAIARHKPWAIINTAGFVRVADAEKEREACLEANTAGPERLARACAEAGIPLVTFSSDLVFDGKLGRAYTETDMVKPTGVYGLSKAKAEDKVLKLAEQALVIRTSAFFGPWDKYNFAWNTLEALSRGEAVRADRDTAVSPTYVPDLCHATLDLLVDGETGIWHLANQGKLSWHEFATHVAEGAGYDPSLVLPVRGDRANTALTSARGIMLPACRARDRRLSRPDWRTPAAARRGRRGGVDRSEGYFSRLAIRIRTGETIVWPFVFSVRPPG
jgi:dTDP-4-dehydrorhamnose reductase